MPFLHPAIAWSALGLAAIPIIIHLLNRRRLRRLDWAAMEFLLAALKRTRRRVRIEQLILLLVRILLMILLALFIARPMLSDTQFSWLASALKKEEKIFILDDSLSLARRHTDGTIFDRGAEAVATELNRLGRRRAGDIVSVVRTSRSDVPPPGIFINQNSAAELGQTVKSYRTTSTRMDLGATLEAIAEQQASTATSGPQHPRSISIVTDLRSVDWTDGAGGPSASIAGALTRLTGGDENPARILVFDVGTDDTTNIALSEIELDGGRPTVGLPTQVRVKVRNHGREPVTGLRVQMTFGPVGPVGPEKDAVEGVSGTVLAPGIERVAGGETLIASIPCTFRSPGQYWARVEVSGSRDPLPEDNQLWFVIDVVDATEVLLVSGEPSSEPWEGETDFLVASLDPDGESSEGISPIVVTEDNTPDEGLERYLAVFLANVHSVPERFRRRLGRYVREGGSLVIFLGDQVDAAEYRRQFGKGEGPPDDSHPWRDMLPADLEELVGGDLTNVGMAPSYEHEYFRLFRPSGARNLLEQVSFTRYWKLAPHDSTRILATFSDGEDSPAIVERTVGDGRVVMFATTADDEWNNWPPLGTLPIVLRIMLESFAHGGDELEGHLAGQPLELPVDVSKFRLEARFRAPDYPQTPEGSLRATPAPAAGGEQGGEFRFALRRQDTLSDGLLRLAYAPRGGGDASWRAVAIHADPEESDLTRLTPSALEELYPDADLRVIRDAKSFTETGRGQFEIADLLLGIFALLLFIEGILACWFAHHKRAGGGRMASPETVPTISRDSSVPKGTAEGVA